MEEVEDAVDDQGVDTKVAEEVALVEAEVVDEIDLEDLAATKGLPQRVVLQQVEATLVTQLHEREEDREATKVVARVVEDTRGEDALVEEVTNEVDDQEAATREEDAEGERLRLHLQEGMQVVARAQVAQQEETSVYLEVNRRESLKKYLERGIFCKEKCRFYMLKSK